MIIKTTVTTKVFHEGRELFSVTSKQQAGVARADQESFVRAMTFTHQRGAASVSEALSAYASDPAPTDS